MIEMTTGEKIFIIFVIALFLILFIVINDEITNQAKIKNYKIPENYRLVHYKDNDYVIMDSTQTKFLLWYGDNIYLFEDNLGNLIDTENNCKEHIMKREAYLKLSKEKELIENKLKENL